MDIRPYIWGAFLLGPALTGLIGGMAYGSATRGAVLATTSALGVLAGVGGWVLIAWGGPLSLLFGPVAMACGWGAGTALAVIAFARMDRLRRSASADPHP